jgi:hypothetical protein
VAGSPATTRTAAGHHPQADDGATHLVYEPRRERFAECGFDIFDVYYVLEKGHIDGKIEAGKREGEWKVKLVDVPDGTSRKMGVVTIVVKEQRLLIKTVEWEDR